MIITIIEFISRFTFSISDFTGSRHAKIQTITSIYRRQPSTYHKSRPLIFSVMYVRPLYDTWLVKVWCSHSIAKYSREEDLPSVCDPWPDFYLQASPVWLQATAPVSGQASCRSLCQIHTFLWMDNGNFGIVRLAIPSTIIDVFARAVKVKTDGNLVIDVDEYRFGEALLVSLKK